MFKHFKFLGETKMKSSVHSIDIPGFNLFDFRGMKLGFRLQEDVYQTGFAALIFPVRYDSFSLKNLNKRKKTENFTVDTNSIVCSKNDGNNWRQVCIYSYRNWPNAGLGV